MPPDPPRGEQALLAPSPSPVTLHYSPATLFLNENPASLKSHVLTALSVALLVDLKLFVEAA